jgi:hypothetical protein
MSQQGGTDAREYEGVERKKGREGQTERTEREKQRDRHRQTAKPTDRQTEPETERDSETKAEKSYGAHPGGWKAHIKQATDAPPQPVSSSA